MNLPCALASATAWELAGERLVESLVQLAKLSGFFALVVLPAVWVCVRRLTELTIIARWAIGLAAGFALFVLEAWYVGFLSFRPLLIFWLTHYGIAAWLGARTAGARAAPHVGSHGPAVSHPIGPEQRGVWWVLVPIAAGVAFQIYAQQFSILPPGVDPAFHCVVAQVQRDAGHVTLDLQPLEDLRLNYPIGMHLWLAVAAEWTGLEIHEVFRQSFIIALCGGALCVAAWAERLFGTTAHATAAALMFVFGSFQTSLFPYTWGGLPSALALWLGMTAVLCTLCVAGRDGAWLGTVLFAGTAVTHHHTLVALFGAVGVVAATGWIVSRASRPGCARMLGVLIAATVLAAPYTVLLALRAAEVRHTGMLAYREGDAMWPWELAWDWGVPLVLLAVVGIMAGIVPRQRLSGRVLMGMLVFWLVCFAVLDWGARWYLTWTGRPEATPFTPTRFLFDAQFLLAIFAGGGFMLAWRWLRRFAFRYALVAAVMCWGAARTSARLEPLLSDLLVPMGHWARHQLPEDALITGSDDIWVTYLFRRQSSSMFVPVSESADTRWRRLKYSLRYETAALSCEEWERRLGVPIYAISLSTDRSWRQPPLAVSGGQALYRFRPAGN